MSPMRSRRWLLWLLLVGLGAVALPVLAQTPAPAQTPTPPPAVLIITPTAQPVPTPQGSLWQQVWAANRDTILLSVLTALIVGILIGVFLKQAAETLARWAGQLFHLLFDRFASAPLLRLRYEKDYRRNLAEAVQELASSNLVDRPVRLEQVYVPVCLTRELLRDRAAVEDLIQWREDRRRRQREKAIEPWAAVRRYHRLVVLGEPGAGKTTYLAHLAFLCARRQRLDSHLPIFIRLRDLVDVERLEEALPRELAERGFPHAATLIKRRLAEGRCLLLLDGLDEVDNRKQHEHVVRLVQNFAGQHVQEGTGNIVVVSCRTYSYEHGQQLRGFTTTQVMEFDDPAIERFVHNWFGQAEALRPLAGGLLDLLSRNRRFQELARNPLLLLLIAHHYERERNLPDVRAELYQHCIRTRITIWNERRGTHHGRFGETAKWQMLRELALNLYQEEKPNLLTQEAILQWLETFMAGRRFPRDSTPEALLDEVVRTSGLIQEWAIGRYGFSHRTLQEYFAAEGIKELGPTEGAAFLGERLPALLQERQAEARWREVVLLYCGLTPNADPLLRRILQQASDDRPAAWLLAGDCLAEGAQRVERDVRRRLTDGLLTLLRRAEGGQGVTLTPEESSRAQEILVAFAEEPAAYVRDLLASDAPHDALLAARLLPAEGADPALRDEVNRRLTALVREGRVAERRVAAIALGWVADGGTEAAAALRAALTDPDPRARAEAARALGRLGADDEATIAALLRLYPDDPDDAPRHAALHALLALGRAADLGMVLVPGGEFLMGSADDDAEADDDEKPQHRLYLPAFYLDRTPVTNAQFERFIQAGGYQNPAYWAEAREAGRWKEGKYVEHEFWGGGTRTQPVYWDDPQWNQPAQPVVGVTWYEALAYARWAGKALPSEAQWEKAASWREGEGERGKKLRYPWGNEWVEGRANTEEAGIGKTTEVGRYSPAGDSPCGAADMAGNVWEWCSTRWGHAYPYDLDDGREDLGSGDDVRRVLRGGSWYNDKKWARCAFRRWAGPWVRGYNFGGLRCCCATSSPSSGSES